MRPAITTILILLLFSCKEGRKDIFNELSNEHISVPGTRISLVPPEGFELAKIPKIENIHQTVYQAASSENALDMGDWHTCETTHCRAGWVVFLAGEKGKELEEAIGTPLAANLIYKESSKIEVKWALRFFESNEVAMADMKRCAELELNN